MPSQKTLLGTMKPVGGGDPIPLLKPEVLIGRRPSCDIQLDFENVSGKHCQLRFVNAVWHVRDMGSTNGTKLNGAALSSEHMIMPDDELGIASHVFTIDYEPGGPAAASHSGGLGGKPVAAAVPERLSLLEMAGLAGDDDRPRPRKLRPEKPPEVVERLSAETHNFADPLPSTAEVKPAPLVDTSDDDFLRLIEEDVAEKSSKDKK